MQRHGRNHTVTLRLVCDQEIANPHHHQPLRLRNRKRLWQQSPLPNARHAQPHLLRQIHPRQAVVIARQYSHCEERSNKKRRPNSKLLNPIFTTFIIQIIYTQIKMNYTISPPNTPSHPLGKLQLPLTVTNCPENRKIIPDKLSIFPKTK